MFFEYFLATKAPPSCLYWLSFVLFAPTSYEGTTFLFILAHNFPSSCLLFQQRRHHLLVYWLKIPRQAACSRRHHVLVYWLTIPRQAALCSKWPICQLGHSHFFYAPRQCFDLLFLIARPHSVTVLPPHGGYRSHVLLDFIFWLPFLPFSCRSGSCVPILAWRLRSYLDRTKSVFVLPFIDNFVQLDLLFIFSCHDYCSQVPFWLLASC